MKTLKTGTTVKVKGVKYVVENARQGRCQGCAAFEKIDLCNSLPYCGDLGDANYIIFKKDVENRDAKVEVKSDTTEGTKALLDEILLRGISISGKLRIWWFAVSLVLFGSVVDDAPWWLLLLLLANFVVSALSMQSLSEKMKGDEKEEV
ncbi:MAG: hypothetical protein LBD76_06620 [Prevotellaceae bacterium]|nr:hypothetical protein [Prevotellaceae bacterium]